MQVASFAEAWIEKTPVKLLGRLSLVASFAEAWIEKHINQMLDDLEESPPSRRRGLKIAFIFFYICDFFVASFAEAWIENFFLASRTRSR